MDHFWIFLVELAGTGKSLALLCAVLAWQRRQAEKVTTVPQIVYGVAGRTGAGEA